MDAGLQFEDASVLATQVRDDLSSSKEVTTGAIRDRVCALLEKRGHAAALEPYKLPLVAPAKIRVDSLRGVSSAFSRGKMERDLRASGMKAEKAEQITLMIYDQLLASGITSISTNDLGFLTYLCLKQEVSGKVARRYLVWLQYERSGRPLLLLVCGTVGTGKSTIATEIAHVLDIVRIQSTDMLREVVREMMPERLLPILHTSSFNAWQALPIRDLEERDRDQLVADGYRSQADLLAIPCEAVLQRAIKEGVPVILEGVHALPELVGGLPDDPDAIRVHVTLAVLKPKELKSRLRGRGAEVSRRRAKRYLNRFESIWSLQSYLLAEADRCDSPIITNDDKEKTVQQIILHVIHELARHFQGSPKDVFGAVVDKLQARDGPDPWYRLLSLLQEQR